MDGWLKGDPGPELAICDPEITYIHEVVGKRLDGLPALKEMFASYGGRPLFESYEILSPKVWADSDMAVLTYQLAEQNNGVTRYWYATNVYRKRSEGWRVIHSHWSAANERQP